MKTKKFKFTETALCLFIVIAAVAAALLYGENASAAQSEKPLELADVSEGAEYIAALVNEGILPVEVKDGKAYFHPDKKVTREYIAAALAKAADIDPSPYESVSLGTADEDEISSEYLPYVKALAYFGKIPVYADVVNGKQTLFFYPKTEISRENAAILISGMINESASSSKTDELSDKTDISPDALRDIDKLMGLGIINGYPDGSFRPKESITRAEFASMLSKSLKYIK